jgi:hypothetical protein
VLRCLCIQLLSDAVHGVATTSQTAILKVRRGVRKRHTVVLYVLFGNVRTCCVARRYCKRFQVKVPENPVKYLDQWRNCFAL